MSGSKLLDDSSSRNATEVAVGLAASRIDQPLGLTVHSIPAPERAMATDGRRTARGRWNMLVLFLVCAAPVVASYFTFYVWRPEVRRNFGELITPQRPLPDQMVVNLAGQASNLQALKGQWLLVSVAAGACDDLCKRHLYFQRQLRESLGQDKDRLDRVWLIPDDAPVPGPLMAGLQDTIVRRVPMSALSDWLAPASGHQLAEHLYLVDPMGNWMLRFPVKLDVSGAARAKRDMERLMRASNSWDRAGRETAPVTSQ